MKFLITFLTLMACSSVQSQTNIADLLRNETPSEKVERTIRNFAGALAWSKDFKFTAPFVTGANAQNKDLQFWREHWQRDLGNAKFAVQDVDITFQGEDQAIARVRYTLKTPLFSSPLFQEEVLLKRNPAGKSTYYSWLISPATQPLKTEAQADKVPLGNAIWSLGHPTLAAQKVRGKMAQSRLKLLGLGFIQWIQDQDEKPWKLTSAAFQKQLEPYVSTPTTFIVPDTVRHWSFNEALNGLALPSPDNPKWRRVVLFYDGEAERPNFSYDGKAAICFVDGHTELVTPEEAKTLIWKP